LAVVWIFCGFLILSHQTSLLTRWNGFDQLARPGAYSGDDWFAWEERPGPGTLEAADLLNDEQIIQVSYVEAKAKA
jgi:hypothetical protein